MQKNSSERRRIQERIRCRKHGACRVEFSGEAINLANYSVSITLYDNVRGTLLVADIAETETGRASPRELHSIGHGRPSPEGDIFKQDISKFNRISSYRAWELPIFSIDLD
jgi:hypothetical protein